MRHKMQDYVDKLPLLCITILYLQNRNNGYHMEM